MSAFSLSSLTSSAHTGRHAGVAKLRSGAQATLRGDIVKGATTQTLASAQVKASAKVLSAIDKNIGTLLDDLA